MRAVTIRQPWASHIAHGEKRVENRSWTPKAPGDLLIHAGAAYERTAPDLGDLPDIRGAVIAVAEVTGWHLADGRCCPPWGFPDVYHWQLANVRALPEPVPAKGLQKLWRPAPKLIAAVQKQLPEVAR